MKEAEVVYLAEAGYFQGAPLHGDVEETHISWVILTKKFAFKLKKPVSFSFLDFSTLKRRKEFCSKELILNKRFSPIYLSLLPVRKDKGQWYLGKGKGKVVDYAVQMKRMASEKRMDKMLQQGPVSKQYIRSLARILVSFHKKAKVIRTPVDLSFTRSLFNDIRGIRTFTLNRLGKKYAALITRSIVWSNTFLKNHAQRMEERIKLGFKRDVHGDLHSGNIFLYKHPVIFDCIEFNDTYRQIDILSEIAFFCMDMEALGQHRLSAFFLTSYCQYLPLILTDEDRRLFIYYKCHRANVRAKIHAMSARQADGGEDYRKHMKALKNYLLLMKTYIDSVSAD